MFAVLAHVGRNIITFANAMVISNQKTFDMWNCYTCVIFSVSNCLSVEWTLLIVWFSEVFAFEHASGSVLIKMIYIS